VTAAIDADANDRWPAREEGTRLGRRRLEDTDAKKVAAIRNARKRGGGIRRIAWDLGAGVGTAIRPTAEA
jgi:hypothetical protein